jgi:hypothetical protein
LSRFKTIKNLSQEKLLSTINFFALKIFSFVAIFISASLFAQQPGEKKILFDDTHAETSGTSADWCIDADLHNLNWSPNASTGGNHSNPQQLPTPTQTLVTTSTVETYWTGALSYWAIDCVNRGYWVETLPALTGQITYGNSSNSQDLSHYNVLVVCEPNIRFTQAEITAMMHFIQNGGSLFMISDHTGSDRNNDGWDSPAIWNDFITNNPVQNNAFGFTFALEDFSDANYTTNVAASSSDSITHGPFGNVSEVKWSNGTCMTINPSQNASVKGHTWKAGAGQTDTAVTCVTARWMCGKVAAIGDSSPPDDGTGNPNSTLYNGYTGDANGNHRPWLMNLIIWLAENPPCNPNGINSWEEENAVSVFPNPTDGKINLSTSPFENLGIIIYNIYGECIHHQIITSSNRQIDLSSQPSGIYFLQTNSGGKHFTSKLIIQH